MIKKIIKTTVLALLLLVLSVVGYNYYYYYKSLRLNQDIYYELYTVIGNFQTSLQSLNDNNVQDFLNKNYTLVKHSNYLKNKNHKIYSNIFVKMNMLEGSLFSNEVSDALLWFNDFNTKLNTFYLLNNELLNSDVIVKDPKKAKEIVANLKSNVLELNTLINTKNETIQAIVNDQKLKDDYFSDLEKNIQLTYKFFEVIDNFMGGKKTATTLVLVQNNYNMNQSGGKWIYYLTLTCKDYKCNVSEIDFVSNITASMVDKLIPPEEIRTKKTIWIYEDLGWFFDFNDSASLALKYFPIKNQFDGILAINVSIFETLMKNMRPIDFKIDDEQTIVNGNEVVRFLVNLAAYKNNKELTANAEKLSLFWNDFSKVFQANYKNLNNLQSFIFNLYNYIDSKKLQLYASKDIIQTLKDLQYNNTPNKIEKADYLAITKSNILDSSIDNNLTFKVNLKVKIDDDNNLTNQAIVKVENKNSTKIKESVYSYFQIWLDKNAELMETIFPSKMGAPKTSSVDYNKHGFITDQKIETINNRTAYLAGDDVRVYKNNDFMILGGWVITSSNQSKKFEINWKPKYQIDKDDNIYRLQVQKQPNVDYLLNVEITYPSHNNGENVIVKNIYVEDDKLIEIKLD